MWLTRQKGYGRNNNYELWDYRPKMTDWTGGTMWEYGGRKVHWTPSEFAKISSTRLKPGEIREVESIEFKFKN